MHAIRGRATAVFLGLVCGCSSEDAPRQSRATEQAPPAGHAHDAHAGELALQKRVAGNPADLNALLALANFYYDADRPHRAIPLYLGILKHDPDNLGVRTDLGTCYKEMGQLDLAQAEYERVLAEHPGHLQATYNLAVVNELAGNRLRAAELWERAATLAEGTPLAKSALEHAAAARKAAAPSGTPPAKKESP